MAMKIKSLLAIALLVGGFSTAFAQSQECITNSSIGHEAAKAKNYADAYEPTKAVIKECPTMKYYTFTDMIDILQSFLSTNQKGTAEYQKFFDELMNLYDLRTKYLPEFRAKGTKVKSDAAALADKAADYLTYAPEPNHKIAYQWFKESVQGDGVNTKASTIMNFLNESLAVMKADQSHSNQFLDDYLWASDLTDQAIAAAADDKAKENMEAAKQNVLAVFINSGMADCETLQNVFGPQVEQNKSNEAFLKNTIAILRMMKCNESEVYFTASDYMYRINPTADAANGVAYMYFKKGEYETAVKYFDEALQLESDNAKKAEIAYAIAASLSTIKQWGNAKRYAQQAISFRDDWGAPHILMAQIYAANPNWSDERSLNACTYYVCVDRLQRAKTLDPSCAEQADELIRTYSCYFPKSEDLFMQGLKKGDRVTVGGIVGETTTIR